MKYSGVFFILSCLNLAVWAFPQQPATANTTQNVSPSPQKQEADSSFLENSSKNQNQTTANVPKIPMCEEFNDKDNSCGGRIYWIPQNLFYSWENIMKAKFHPDNVTVEIVSAFGKDPNYFFALIRGNQKQQAK